MGDARVVNLNRPQFSEIGGKDPRATKQLENLLNSLAVEVIPGGFTSDYTFTVPNSAGQKTILIAEADLVADAGGPFTLTITTGAGTDVLVPIAAFGDTILSGPLLFDIYIDSSGNVISKDWAINGLNSNGKYSKEAGGLMSQHGSPSASLTTSAVGTVFRALYTVIFPEAFSASQRYSIDISATSDTISPWSSGYDSFAASSVRALIYAGVAGTNTILIDWIAAGRWR